MKTTEYLHEIVNELNRSVDFIDNEVAEKLAHQMLESNKIFVAGAGRSGLMAKAFAMRLMQLGLTAYVVGETVTPNMDKHDMILIGSGSGETGRLIAIAKKAKKLGAVLAITTIVPESTIGALADITVKLPGSPKDQSESEYKTIQPMGSLFEQTLLLFFDALILRLMEIRGIDTETMYGRHANLE
jgi:6-phospho-3-hexuloisomerase